MAWMVKLLSQAALGALVRFLSKEAIEDLIITLAAQAMRYIAKKTDSTEDDAMVERWISRARESSKNG